MGTSALQTALKNLSRAIPRTDKVLEDLRAEQDPLAVHIFVFPTLLPED